MCVVAECQAFEAHLFVVRNERWAAETGFEVLAEIEVILIDLVEVSAFAVAESGGAAWTRSSAVQDEHLVEKLVDDPGATMRVVAGRYHPSQYLSPLHVHHKACDGLVVIQCQANWNAAGAEPSKRSHLCFFCLLGGQPGVRYWAGTRTNGWLDRICCMRGRVQKRFLCGIHDGHCV